MPRAVTLVHIAIAIYFDLPGQIPKIRNPEKIAEKITWFADHRSVLCDMSQAAKNKAAGLTWERYGQLIANAILDLN